MLDGCFCFPYGILSEREYTKAHSTFGHNYSQNHRKRYEIKKQKKKKNYTSEAKSKAKERHPKHRKEIGNGLQKDGYFVPLLDTKIFFSSGRTLVILLILLFSIFISPS